MTCREQREGTMPDSRRRTTLQKLLIVASSCILAFGIGVIPSSAAVRHRSTVTLHLTDHLVANGRIRVPDGTGACLLRRVIRVHYRKNANTDWVVLGVERAHHGEYHIEMDDRSGRYYVLVKQRRLSNGDLCESTRSEIEHHLVG
jgi:hypothetical protein